jgi:diguanylate cyclase
VLNRAQALILTFGSVLVGVDVLAMAITTPGPTTLWVSDVVSLVAAVIAAAACWSRERHELGRIAFAWQLLAIGCLFWAAGQLYWSIDELLLQADLPVADRAVPFPSVADVGFLAFPLVAAAALMILPSQLWRSRARARIVCDALLLGTAILAACWAAFLRRMVEAFSAQHELAGLVAFAYPASDSVLLALAALAGAYAARHERRARWFLLTGLALFTFADLVFWMETVNGTYTSASPVDLGWPAGFLLLAVAARERGPPGALLKLRTDHPGHWVRSLPLVSLGVAVAALLATARSTGVMDATIVTLVVFAAGLAMVRELAWWSETRGTQVDGDPMPQASLVR